MRCDLYAVGDTVVYARGRPPLPPEPWLAHDSSIEVPFTADSVPLVNDAVRGNLQKNYMHGRKSKALALSENARLAAMKSQHFFARSCHAKLARVLASRFATLACQLALSFGRTDQHVFSAGAGRRSRFVSELNDSCRTRPGRQVDLQEVRHRRRESPPRSRPEGRLAVAGMSPRNDGFCRFAFAG